MRSILSLFAAGVLTLSAGVAAGEPPTVGSMIKTWAVSLGKGLKTVKSKERQAAAQLFTDRALDSLRATGLQSGGTIYSQLSTELQTALTRLRDDLRAMQDKSEVTDDLINALCNDLRDLSQNAAAPSIETVQTLVTSVQLATADGELTDKEKAQITLALSAVLSTTGITTQQIAKLQADVNAILAASGVTATDVMLIKSDLDAIIAIAAPK